jgi:hypothetical protein
MKFFSHFPVFRASKNNSQSKNIFNLTKKKFFSFEQWFLFLNFVNHFSSLTFSYLNHRTTGRPSLDPHRAFAETWSEHRRDPVQTSTRTNQDVIGTHSGFHQAIVGTQPGLNRAIVGTWPGLHQATLGTSLGHCQKFTRPLPRPDQYFAKTTKNSPSHRWDPVGTLLRPVRDFTRTSSGHYQEFT